MGEAMNPPVSSHDPWAHVFNSPLECGLRSAVLLLAAYPGTCDLQRLVQYDYLIVHSGDIEGGPESIHPATPHRSGELLVRRSLVREGIDFMIIKRVIDHVFADGGIEYSAGDYAVVFLESLRSGYTRKLQDRARWVIDRFQGSSDEALRDFMQERWSLWGAEFVRESLFRGLES
jgi:hypothetical protein